VAPNSTLHFFNAPPGVSEAAVMQVASFFTLFHLSAVFFLQKLMCVETSFVWYLV